MVTFWDLYLNKLRFINSKNKLPYLLKFWTNVCVNKQHLCDKFQVTLTIADKIIAKSQNILESVPNFLGKDLNFF